MKKTMLLVITAVIFTHLTHAAVTVYEGFDYPSTETNLLGKTGGTGWSGSWGLTGGGGPDVVAGYQDTSIDNTPNPFTPIGGAAVVRNNAGHVSRGLTSTIDLSADSGPIYFSYLINAEAVSSNENQLSFYDGSTSVLDTGIRNDDFRLRSGGSAQLITGTPVNDTTYFIAGFIDPNSATNDVFGYNVYSGSDTIASSVDTATSGDWLLYDNGKSLSDVIDSIWLIGAGGNDSQETRFDEIRLGDSWADVTQIPEPTTGLLFFLGASALFFLNRKKS